VDPDDGLHDPQTVMTIRGNAEFSRSRAAAVQRFQLRAEDDPNREHDLFSLSAHIQKRRCPDRLYSRTRAVPFGTMSNFDKL
jgi:hypothetical protein